MDFKIEHVYENSQLVEVGILFEHYKFYLGISWETEGGFKKSYITGTECRSSDKYPVISIEKGNVRVKAVEIDSTRLAVISQTADRVKESAKVANELYTQLHLLKNVGIRFREEWE